MKKYLIPNGGKFYKANLHCHSTVSDGALTPEEVKAEYQSRGYSIVAYTDHDVFITHDELTDDKFLALNGFEMEVNEEGDRDWNLLKTCHVCYVAIKKDNIFQPMWNEVYAGSNKYIDKVKKDGSKAPYVRRFTGEGISEMMKIGREEGFFVTYNHPTWSRETYAEYINYEGMHAFEMYNGGCIVEGYDDYNPRVYDDILLSGKRIFCIGTDDNHNRRDKNSRQWDSGVAFTMIKAENLEYETITDALVKGNFYSSEGPIINALWVEDGKIHIECESADRIICTYGARRGDIVYDETGEGVTNASFSVDKDDIYVRITVIDKKGDHATTNAYFVDELM